MSNVISKEDYLKTMYETFILHTDNEEDGLYLFDRALEMTRAQRDSSDREAKAEKEEALRQEGERIIKLLPEITTRFDHNKTCFDCVERIKRQALKQKVKGGRQ